MGDRARCHLRHAALPFPGGQSPNVGTVTGLGAGERGGVVRHDLAPFSARWAS